jgi:hypothetical protein
MQPDRVLGQERLNEHEAFRNFIEALKVAESAARQLAFVRSDKQWMLVAAAMEGARVRATDLAQARHRPLIHPWVQ